MTHALHRTGSVESLSQDYVLLAIPAKTNREAVGPALARVAEIVLESAPSNLGSSALGQNMALGLDPAEFISRIAGSDGLQCAFASREQLAEVLRKLKEADLGVSITVSGLLDEIFSLAGDLELTPHTVDLSLGLLGDTDGVPDQAVLDIVTMCGHDRVAAGLIRQEAQAVASGARCADEAAVLLGKPCTCGIFNLTRAARMLKEPDSQS